MVKYKIWHESVVCSSTKRRWLERLTSKDLYNWCNEGDRFPDVVGTFDTLEEAKAAFNERKKKCSISSLYQYGSSRILAVDFDFIQLVSEDEDDGVFSDLEIIEEYFAPTPFEIDQYKDDDDDEEDD